MRNVYFFTILIFFISGIYLLLFIKIEPISAASINEYDELMIDWDKNIAIAKGFIKEAEQSLIEGDVLSSCVSQKQASKFGIKATNSRLKAAEEIGDHDLFKRMQDGLNKWKALNDFCS